MDANAPLSGAWSPQMVGEMPPQQWDHTHSRQGSISSQHSGASASSAQHAVQSSAPTVGPPSADSTEYMLPRCEPSYPMDPLTREYPRPIEDLDVREALERKPGRWTLGHYIKATPVRSLQEAREWDPEKVARDMEAKKQELMRAKDEIRGLTLPK